MDKNLENLDKAANEYYSLADKALKIRCSKDLTEDQKNKMIAELSEKSAEADQDIDDALRDVAEGFVDMGLLDKRILDDDDASTERGKTNMSYYKEISELEYDKNWSGHYQQGFSAARRQASKIADKADQRIEKLEAEVASLKQQKTRLVQANNELDALIIASDQRNET